MLLAEDKVNAYRAIIEKRMPNRVTITSDGKELVYHIDNMFIRSITTGEQQPSEGKLFFYTEDEWAEYKKFKQVSRSKTSCACKQTVQNDGVQLIATERKRHFELGYDAHHDSHEVKGELAVAAGLYALDGTYADQIIKDVAADLPDEYNPIENELWPWADMPDKRGKLDRIRQLTIAGALIAAEIDRLQANDTTEAG